MPSFDLFRNIAHRDGVGVRAFGLGPTIILLSEFDVKPQTRRVNTADFDSALLNVHTSTCRAYTAAEMEKIVSKVHSA